MKYLCLVYNDEKRSATLSVREREALVGEALSYNDELGDRGYLIAAHTLQPAGTATTVRVRNGRLSTTEGPVAAAGEQLTGVVLIEARDLNEAIRVASGMPGARLGTIEVRPIGEPEQQDR